MSAPPEGPAPGGRDRDPGDAPGPVASDPPRLAEALLRRRLPDDVVGRSVLGDLREEHSQVRARRGRFLASLWYWGQVPGMLAAWPRPGRGTGPAGRGGISDALGQDLRFALRALVRRPGFSLAVVLTLALGIGANTAIFSVVHAVLLRPLPYGDPDRLVLIWYRVTNTDRFPVSGPDFVDFRERTTRFQDLAALNAYDANVGGLEGDAPERVSAANVTGNLFSLLGVSPALGRDFLPEDAPLIPFAALQDPDGELPPGAAILAHDYWESRFGGDPGILGRDLRVDGRPHTVVGVLPAGFRLLMPPEMLVGPDVRLWTVFQLDFAQAPRRNVFLRVVARLRPGVTVAEARAEMEGVVAQLREEHFSHRAVGVEARMAPLREDVVAGVEGTLLALLAAVGLVLLIACANVANLLMARSAGRRGELAIRSALGASRGRILGQMLAENAVLAAAGGIAGVGLAALGLRALLALQPPDLPRLQEAGLSPVVLAFAGAATLLVALLFGSAPSAFRVLPEPRDALSDRSRGEGRRSARVGGGLVVLEVALCLALLTGTALVLRSFQALRAVDPGFHAPASLTFQVSLPFARYRTPEEQRRFFEELHAGLEALPGVERMGAVRTLPLSGQTLALSYRLGSEPDDSDNPREATLQPLLPGYLEAMDARLVEGRLPTREEHRDGALVAVVDELVARRWEGESALGKTVKMRLPVFGQEPVMTHWQVVGVVRHLRQEALAFEGRETIFVPMSTAVQNTMAFVLRAGARPEGLAQAARREVHALDPELPVFDVRTMEERVGEAMAPVRFTLTLVAVFGAMALLLAVVGLYGVISYWVRRRTRAIGVRMALGADRGAILRQVVGRGMRLVAAGVLAGSVAALWLVQGLRGVLVGVEPTDPVSLLAAAASLTAVALLACLLPAWRATRVSVVEVLRGE